MAISTLRYEGRKKPSGQTQASGDHFPGPKGFLQYAGDPTGFYEWEFRARCKIAGTKEDERKLATARIVEGLQGDAFQIARDIGLAKLSEPEGFEVLVTQMRTIIFPIQKLEAKELLRIGQSRGSIMSRQSGEPMTSYISRRRRWWTLLKELDPSIGMSDSLLGDLLLEHSSLNKTERLLVLTSTQNSTNFEDVAWALVEQHGLIHADENRQFSSRTDSGPRPWSSVKVSWKQKPSKFAHVARQYYDEDPDYEEEDFDGEEEEEYYDDDVEEAQLETLCEMLDEGYDDPEDLEALVNTQSVAYLAKGHVEGKGKGNSFQRRPFKGRGKGSSLTLEDRRAKLRQLKERSTCKACGRKGHWAGDPGCPGKKTGGESRPSTNASAPNRERTVQYAFLLPEEVEKSEAATALMASKQTTPEFDDEEEMWPHDESPIFQFGQYRGLSFHQVMSNYPTYATWAIGQSSPGLVLQEFIAWVRANYSWQGNQWKRNNATLTNASASSNLPPVPSRKSKLSTLTKDPAGPCKDGCPSNSISRAGSTAGYIRETCLKCGHVKQTPKAIHKDL